MVCCIYLLMESIFTYKVTVSNTDMTAGCAVAQAVSRQPLTAEASPYGNCRVALGQGFTASTSVFPSVSFHQHSILIVNSSTAENIQSYQVTVSLNQTHFHRRDRQEGFRYNLTRILSEIEQRWRSLPFCVVHEQHRRDNAYNVIGEPEQKGLLVIDRHRCENNIKINLKERGCEIYWTGSGMCPMPGSFTQMSLRTQEQQNISVRAEGF
jgi:hypothetical protein